MTLKRNDLIAFIKNDYLFRVTLVLLLIGLNGLIISLLFEPSYDEKTLLQRDQSFNEIFDNKNKFISLKLYCGCNEYFRLQINILKFVNEKNQFNNFTIINKVIFDNDSFLINLDISIYIINISIFNTDKIINLEINRFASNDYILLRFAILSLFSAPLLTIEYLMRRFHSFHKLNR